MSELMNFDLPQDNSSIIKVIGVGGSGGNAVNHMFNKGINGVDFVICNTDEQALVNSPITNKIQLGKTLTQGLGAGNEPSQGREAAKESYDEISAMLSHNAKMVFVTAGMGGGTGTGAAPVIAQQAKDMGILTVGIVTLPFRFEGMKRKKHAIEGLKEMRHSVDSLLVVDNEKIREIYGNFPSSQAFGYADDILTLAAKGIADRVHFPGFQRGKQVYECYKASDVFVMPSVSEPFGIAPLEAMQCGTPSIISKQSGCGEILDKVIKVDYWDINAMADAIYSLCTNEGLHSYLRDEGLKEVAEITWVKVGHRIRKLYDECIYNGGFIH